MSQSFIRFGPRTWWESLKYHRSAKNWPEFHRCVAIRFEEDAVTMKQRLNISHSQWITHRHNFYHKYCMNIRKQIRQQSEN